MKFGVVRFPGSNCDQDAFYAVRDSLGQPVEYLWHGETDLKGAECIIIPGGFSYGDYLRCGAIARFSPIMKAVIDFAHSGGLVWGICNGFQILCEAGLLPGALVRNDGLRFTCRQTQLTVASSRAAQTRELQIGETLTIPVAHGEGKYTCSPETLGQLQREDRILFRYAEGSNPNGSIDHIAGITDESYRVVGMMPHPERAMRSSLGSAHGLKLFKSLLASSAV